MNPRLSTLSLVIFLIFAHQVLAQQYFGQNRVRYRTFDFKVMKTEHFDICYYDDLREGWDRPQARFFALRIGLRAAHT